MSKRTRRGVSLVALTVVAALPATALAGVWQYAEANVPPPTTTTTTTVAPPPVDELTTDLLSFRRSPEPLALAAAVAERDRQLAALGDDLAARLGDGACMRLIAADGSTIAEVAPNAPVLPASTQKLLIAAVALDVLGPDYRFRTELLATAPPVDGVIAGDVYLVGGGDPLLTTTIFPDPNPLPAFNVTPVDPLADMVQLAGVVLIEGELVGDGSRYVEDDDFRPSSWGADITFFDGGPIDALLINDGLITAAGDRGANPNRSAARVFADLLIARGITIVGDAAHRTRPDDVEFTSLGFVESAPLTDVLVEMLHTSDNNTAEMLLLEIGHAAGDPSRQGGVDAVWDRLGEWGVSRAGVNVADGSGLSHLDSVSCTTLTDLFTVAPVGEALIDLLPAAGRDGTLRDEFLGSSAEGRLQAKTGTLTGVKALAGVTPDGAGDDVTFAIVLNGDGVDAVEVYRPVWDSLVETVAGYPVAVTPDLTPFEPR